MAALDHGLAMRNHISSFWFPYNIFQEFSQEEETLGNLERQKKAGLALNLECLGNLITSCRPCLVPTVKINIKSMHSLEILIG